MLEGENLNVLLSAAAIVVAVAGSWSLYKLAGYLHHKALGAVAEYEGAFQTRALRAAEVLAACAVDGVMEVESILRPTIRDVSADGKLTAEAGRRLRDEAIRVAWLEAKACYEAPLRAGGFDMSSPPVALTHLVEAAAAKYAGSSRPPPTKKTPRSPTLA